MKKITTLTLSATKGTQTIAKAKDVFTSLIDYDFVNWKTDIKEKDTKKTQLEVYEMTTDATFSQIFTQPDKMTLTQGQIIKFCKNHKSVLKQDNYGTLFLFKVGEEFFVACVYVYSDDRLSVYVYRLSFGNVWYAGDGRRVVLPQLTTKYLEIDTLTPSHSDTLEKRLKNVEQFMRDNFKGFSI